MVAGFDPVWKLFTPDHEKSELAVVEVEGQKTEGGQNRESKSYRSIRSLFFIDEDPTDHKPKESPLAVRAARHPRMT